MGALHAPVTFKPGSIPDPAIAAEPLMFCGHSTFWAETILNTHNE
jgi:hypothetical protein